jgi:quinol monooxygenase YgiN
MSTPLLRVWLVRVRADRTTAYEAYARDHSRAMFLAQPGCLGVFFARMACGRHAACSFWRDQAAIDALAYSASYQATAAGLMALEATEGKPDVHVHMLTAGELAWPALVQQLDALNQETQA